jgi:hypothetical protein
MHDAKFVVDSAQVGLFGFLGLSGLILSVGGNSASPLQPQGQQIISNPLGSK